MAYGNQALIPFDYLSVFFLLLYIFTAVGKGAVQRRVRLGPTHENSRPTGSSEEGP